MSNPLDDVLMAKEAGFFDAMKSGLKVSLGGEAIGKGIGAGVIGAGMAGIGAAAMKIRDSIGKKRDFKEMMSLNGDLKEEQGQDPKFFNASYNSLRRMNPEFGSDPIVSGAYMRKMMANPDAAGLTVAQSVKPMQQKPSGMSFDDSTGPFKYSG
jgi:hypothetical protein